MSAVCLQFVAVIIFYDTHVQNRKFAHGLGSMVCMRVYVECSMWEKLTCEPDILFNQLETVCGGVRSDVSALLTWTNACISAGNILCLINKKNTIVSILIISNVGFT